MDSITIKFAAIAVHLKEYIDTNESFDLEAASGLIKDAEVQEWIEDNFVLLPVRRDGGDPL